MWRDSQNTQRTKKGTFSLGVTLKRRQKQIAYAEMNVGCLLSPPTGSRLRKDPKEPF